MKQPNGHQIIELFESWSPKRFAMEGDPVGLHIGQLNRPVTNVLVTLDVNETVVQEAIDQNANLIIAHHPPLFRPLKQIDMDTAQGRMIEKAIKHDISIYAAHTNLDVAPGGVNDMLAEKLGLEDTTVMEPTIHDPLYKLAVFCPNSHADELRTALAQSGAGALGDYSGCSFTSAGIGRFTPNKEAHPFIGESGKTEEVEEQRIEVVMPGSLRNRVLKAMLAAHPYEEPAYDFFVLDQRTNEYGLGRVGRLKETVTLAELSQQVKKTLEVPMVRLVGDENKVVRKVAVLGGDGNKYIYAAKRAGADVLITGDLYYHTAQDAEAIGLSVIDPGHNVEKVMIEGVAKKMKQLCADKKWPVSFIQSIVKTEPFRFL